MLVVVRFLNPDQTFQSIRKVYQAATVPLASLCTDRKPQQDDPIRLAGLPNF